MKSNNEAKEIAKFCKSGIEIPETWVTAIWCELRKMLI